MPFITEHSLHLLKLALLVSTVSRTLHCRSGGPTSVEKSEFGYKTGELSGIPRVMSGDSSHLRRYWIPALKEAIFGQLQPRHGPSPHEPGGSNIETLVVLVSGWHRYRNNWAAHSVVLDVDFIRRQ